MRLRTNRHAPGLRSSRDRVVPSCVARDLCRRALLDHRTGVTCARRRAQLGQASVELVAVLPLVVLVGALAWQLALAGQAAWMCAHAARAAARAEVVGRDGRAAARSALPDRLERGLRVERRRGGGVRVRVNVPLLLSHRGSGVSVSASASLGGAR